MTALFMKHSILIFSFFVSLTGIGQTVNYNDVAVIINDNSEKSIAIGTYFQQARNIPNQNMIHVFAPVAEKIDSLQFEQVRSQIEGYLVNNNLVDSFNYLVTTAGIPLKIGYNCIVDTFPGASCASFDSELSIILGPYSSSIGQSFSIVNPMHNTSANFSRNSVGIYLVTRLDGYTEQDVFNLIDRSGPLTGLNQSAAQGIVDISNSSGGDSAYFANDFIPAYDYLVNNQWNATLDLDFDPLVNQDNVFAYIALGHGPLPYHEMNYVWTDASIAIMDMCNSTYTLDSSVKGANELLLGDMIAGGATGAYGNVDYIYFSQIMDPEVFVSRYLDTANHFNLAESFYMANKTLSWQSVIIGDPKSSVIIDNVANSAEIPMASVNIYPNPSSGTVTVKSSQSITAIVVFDLSGALVRNLTEVNAASIALDLHDLRNGVYILQIEMGSEIVRERLVVAK